ncbi:NADH-quinone oxidoreductase subunit C [Streptomyces sp. NPDC127098]|uniref:NADH-quinone oxidoreductase subunit C n=1 Tax=Streptomyces sp. NPDC127098 TaxID=3347137 RepID=UPI00365CA883
MTAAWLPAEPAALFGADATASFAYEVLTVDVPAAAWADALTVARDELGCTFFDWLSAVDEPGTGFLVCAHVVALGTPPRRLLLRTTVPHENAALATATGVYPGAAWHERETHEMFGVDFPGHPGLAPLLLPESFEGYPLRKDFVLAARVAKAWPGAKEPGESDHGGPRRRQMLPPGVPDPNEWGPLAGTLPPAPRREGARSAPSDRPRRSREGAPGAPTDRPRRSRSAADGSASQRPASPAEPGEAGPARRGRSAADGSASQRRAGEAAPPTEAGEAGPPRRSRSVADGSASQRAASPAEPGQSEPPEATRSARQRAAREVEAAAPDADGAEPPEATRSASQDAPGEGEAAAPGTDGPGSESAEPPDAASLPDGDPSARRRQTSAEPPEAASGEGA